MTLKEEAIILVHEFELLIAKSELMVYTGSLNFNQDIEDGVLEQKKVAKQCALIYVDRNIKENGFYKDTSIHTSKGRLDYWEEFKEEINKL